MEVVAKTGLNGDKDLDYRMENGIAEAINVHRKKEWRRAGDHQCPGSSEKKNRHFV